MHKLEFRHISYLWVSYQSRLKILYDLKSEKAESLIYHNLGHRPKINGKATSQPVCLVSCSRQASQPEGLKYKYIMNQKEHHKIKTYKEEIEEFLIEYDLSTWQKLFL